MQLLINDITQQQVGTQKIQSDSLYRGALQSHTPIFLAKEDLDTALGTAHAKRNSVQADELRKKAAKLTQEYEEAKKIYADCTDKKEKKQAKERADKALAGADKAREQAAKVEKASLPKIEVGCFEDVIAQMQKDTKGEWSTVMFIPPGAFSGGK